MTDRSATNPLLRVLSGQRQSIPPIWLMRQAGRYLPEYRALRAQAHGFLDLCFDPARAAEVTLQPIRRFGFDAAILFSDILVVPHALGQRVTFVEGEGPRLDALGDPQSLQRLNLEIDHALLAPVYEAIVRVKQELPAEVALLGFCGGPWTLATYMVAGCGTPDQAPARMFAYRYPDAFAQLIDVLTDGVDRLSGPAIRRRRRRRTDFRYLGWECCLLTNSTDGASNRWRESWRGCAAKYPPRKSSDFHAGPARS